MPQLSNEATDLPLLFEQVRNFGGGEDSFRDPIEIDPDQCQHLLNIIIRDKLKARTRPGADPVDGAAISANPIRGLKYFSTPTYSQLVSARNAQIYTWDGATRLLRAGWVPANSVTPVEMEQGVNKLLLSDGIGNLQSWDGAVFTDLGNADVSPPVGATILRWHTGRMFASGQASNPDTIYVSLRLDFSQGAWNRTTRSFQVGGGEGDPIVALVSLPGFILGVIKQNSVWLVNTDPRNEPANFAATQVSETVSSGSGGKGKRAFCVYGNDCFFDSDDGIRSVQRMQAAAGQFNLSAPISESIQPLVDRINPNYASLISAIKYKEFAFFSVPLDASTFNNAVLVWNGRLGRWLGQWSGWTPSCWEITRFGGVPRLVFGDNAGLVNQWKDLNATDVDATYKDNAAGYASKLWTRSMIFGDLEAPKSGFNAKVRFNAGNANLIFTAVGNDADLSTWAKQITPSGDILGTDVLPFLLSSQQPGVLPFSLRGLPSFNEFYLKIESATGWFELRNLTVGARVRPLKTK